MQSLLIHGGTVVKSEGSVERDLMIQDGFIESHPSRKKLQTTNYPSPSVPARAGDRVIRAGKLQTLDASGLLILPGLIDCHVHLREPGLTHKGDMETETRAALAGGVTTVCDMPNTNPPTVSIAALMDKVDRAEKISDCDIRFFFGITEGSHLPALLELWEAKTADMQRLKDRCAGVKLYLDHSTGNQKVQGSVVEDVFKASAQYGFVVVCHCEDPNVNVEARRCADVSTHSRMRPPASEIQAVAFAIALLKSCGGRLHVAHLSTRGGLDLVRKAKKDGLVITCEAATHHLFLTEEDEERLGTLGKMNPPLRSASDRNALWEGIADGTIDCIATDHAPHTLAEKRTENPLDAPSGVPGVETMLPLLLTVAAGGWPHPKPLSTLNSQLSASDIIRLCFENPNRIFDLGKKGIEAGAKADVVLVDPIAEWTIEAKNLHHKCGWTPYEGWRVKGRVVKRIFDTRVGDPLPVLDEERLSEAR